VPDPTLIAVIVLVVVAPFAIWAYRRDQRKRRSESWSATVTGIDEEWGRQNQYGTRDSEDTLFVRVRYRRDNGVDDHFVVSAKHRIEPVNFLGGPSVNELLTEWAVGDRIEKRAGEDYPSRG
jgi:hypothetical protein